MSGVGLYVHIPYCTSICPYCDFNAYVAPKGPWDDLQAALLCELQARAALFEGPLKSIYFGGGTPSLAPPALIGQVIAAAQKYLGLKANAEITLEANPGTLNPAKLAALRHCGINRLSMGWQSTNDKILKVLGRGHSAQDSMQAFTEAREAGFDTISLDLIFAVPGQTRAHLQADLDKIVALSPEHVSLYAMTFKAGTPFERRRQKGTLTPVDEAIELNMMEQIDSALEAAGYEHYEVSNYAKPGAFAVHNALYWQEGQYLGVGPGAHSFLRRNWSEGWRWESLRKPPAYIEAWLNLPLVEEVLLSSSAALTATSFFETLNAEQLRAERVLCGLRHSNGIPVEIVTTPGQKNLEPDGFARAFAQGWLRAEGKRLIATVEGRRNVDALALLLL